MLPKRCASGRAAHFDRASSQSDRGAAKVSIEPGDVRASAVYELSMKLTRYDRVISTYRCSAKSQVVLVAGKVLFSNIDQNCIP